FGGLAVGGVAIGGGGVGYYATGGWGWGVHALLADRQDPGAVAFFETWIEDWPMWLAMVGVGTPLMSAAIYLFIWVVFRFLSPDEDGLAGPSSGASSDKAGRR